MRVHSLVAGLAALGLLAPATGCALPPAAGRSAGRPGPAASAAATTRSAAVEAVATRAPALSGTPLGAARRPAGPYAVGVRQLTVSRGIGRPLPTTVWYPAAGAAGGPARPGVPVAPGRFPVVLFSHGLHSEPGRHAALILTWATAGFVVAAPAYPYTRAAAVTFSRADVRNQPADAWYVLQEVAALNRRPGDAFAGRLDPARLAAAGHSAGGFTTAGLFTQGHDRNLRAGIVIAGGGLAGAFAGPPAALLFVHGDADRVVPVGLGRAAYDRVPWAKAFLTLLGQGHGEYLGSGRPGFDVTAAVTTDFLRWSLYRDAAARARLTAEGAVPGITTLATAL